MFNPELVFIRDKDAAEALRKQVFRVDVRQASLEYVDINQEQAAAFRVIRQLLQTYCPQTLTEYERFLDLIEWTRQKQEQQENDD